VCPNFVVTRGIFNSQYEPPECRWGSEELRQPPIPDNLTVNLPEEPEGEDTFTGRFCYIRMELCNSGDAEEYIKTLPNQIMSQEVSQAMLFQMAFALHAAADRYSLKHYDLKLLNIFLHETEAPGGLVMRYGLGSHVFAVRMPAGHSHIAKLADLGTSNIKPETNGQPVTIAQFTTLENTPPDFLILGDAATQGHGHDCWGLGLCMIHLFTGHAPYEEIVTCECPKNLKSKLKNIWEDENLPGYQTIRSVILSDVFKDEAGNILEGDPDDTFYDTLYRILVLFGVPRNKFGRNHHPLVWDAIVECLEGIVPASTNGVNNAKRRNVRPRKALDATQYRRDQRKFSLANGNNKYIARARKRLKNMNGAMELLSRLCSFDPAERASALDVLNSPFMANLREAPGQTYCPDETVLSYTSFATHC